MGLPLEIIAPFQKRIPLLAEYIGTFLLTLAYLSTTNLLIIGAIFLTILFLIIPISGGCLNPVITCVMYLNGKLGKMETLLYIIMQFLAGTTSFYLYNILQG